MLIEVALTKEIINESLSVHYKYASFEKKYSTLLPPVIMIIIGISNVLTEQQWVGGRFGWGHYIKVSKRSRYFTFLITILLAVSYSVWYFYRRTHAGKTMLQNLGSNANYQVNANPDGLIFYFSNGISNEQWSAFPKAIVGKSNVLLYQKNGTYLIFYHSFFANSDFSSFRQLVCDHVQEVKQD